MSRIQTGVFKYLDDHIGQTVYCNDIAEELKVDKSSIMNVISRCIRNNINGYADRLQVIQRGNVWCLHAATKSAFSNKLYEQLATTKSGVIILQDEDGEVYKVVPI